MAGARPRVLVVAGHDPSGAGVDADLDALGTLPVEAVLVVTARTRQDERAVHAIGARDAEAWLAEARAAARAGVAALKTGLLPGAEHVERAARLVRELRALHGDALPVVVDPVIAASSGGRFLDAAGVEALRGELIGLGVVVTPNLHEAADLAGVPAAALEHGCAARERAAELLLGLGARAVVIKGGHGSEDPVRDLVAAADGTRAWLEHPRTAGGKVRGSGCRFASVLAGALALGRHLPEAAALAGEHVAGRIAAGRAR
jgi:hydroxymethylpyrimidine/phosphomethylpyrimidine kinase